MIGIYILIGGVLLLTFIFKQPAVKGKVGEIVVSLCLKLMLNKKYYHIVNNITIPDDQGGTTQIDHIVISKYGIFVIETKNMKGWIYGEEKSPKWTQVIFKVKNSFQNPLRQNYKHIMCLSQMLDLPKESFIHVIAFVGGCTLKEREKLPENVVTGGFNMVDFISSKNKELLNEDEIPKIIESIENGGAFHLNAQLHLHFQLQSKVVESGFLSSGRRNSIFILLSYTLCGLFNGTHRCFPGIVFPL